ncbi:MAG TPA: hypothetical protein VI792_07105, partial [Candidatus Eisenbacteria bacterium]
RAVEAGQWPSMDGRHPTNGFHPLFMLLLVGLQALAGTDPRRLLPLVMTLNLALNAAAAWIVARAAGRSAGAPLLAALILALSPGWMAHGLVGVENGVSSLLLLVIALRWRARLARARTPAPAGPGAVLADGGLCGLAMLARTDTAIFVAALLAVALATQARGQGARAALRDAALTCAAAALVVAPWLALSLWRFGTITQDSAAALAVRYRRAAGSPGSPEWLRLAALSLAFWTFRFARAWGLAPLTGWLAGLSVPWDRWRADMRRAWLPWLPVALCAVAVALRANDTLWIGSVRQAALEVGLACVALACGLVMPRAAPAGDRAWWWALAGAAVLEAAIYTVFFQAFQVWYTTGAVLVGILLLTWPALAGLARARPGLVAALAALVALDAGLAVARYLERGGREGMSRTVLADGAALRGRLEAATAAAGGRLGFGCFDSGKLSYLVHPFPVANLDGVMSHAASVALERGELPGFMRREGVTHIVTSMDRAAVFQRVSPFEVRPDSALARRLGVPILAVVR